MTDLEYILLVVAGIWLMITFHWILIAVWHLEEILKEIHKLQKIEFALRHDGKEQK